MGITVKRGMGKVATGGGAASRWDEIAQGWGMGALLVVLVAAGGNMYPFWKYKFGSHLFDFAKCQC